MTYKRFAEVLGAINLAVQEKALMPERSIADTVVSLAVQYGKRQRLTEQEVVKVISNPLSLFLEEEED